MHHARLTRACAGCRGRRTFKGGRLLRLGDRQIFICGGCREPLDRLQQRQARELEALLEKILMPLLTTP